MASLIFNKVLGKVKNWLFFFLFQKSQCDFALVRVTIGCSIAEHMDNCKHWRKVWKTKGERRIRSSAKVTLTEVLRCVATIQQPELFNAHLNITSDFM